jgi:hypothetical protein
LFCGRSQLLRCRSTSSKLGIFTAPPPFARHLGIFTADENTLGSPIPFYSIRAVREVVVLVLIVVVCVIVVCGFQTSSRCMWMSAIEPCYVDVGHRAVVCGCRPSCRYFLQVFETSPCRGGSAEFLIDNIIFLSFLQRRARRSGARVCRSSSSALRVCLHRVASPLHRLAMAPLA